MNHFYQSTADPFLVKYQLIFSYLFLGIVITLFFNIDHNLWLIIQKSVSDAYIQVSTFVAGTLLLFYTLEKSFKIDIGVVLQKMFTDTISFYCFIIFSLGFYYYSHLLYKTNNLGLAND